jgi:hypothetical protein
MEFIFAVPERGCIDLINAVETVFEAIRVDLEHEDGIPYLTANIPPKFESTFTEWSAVKGFSFIERVRP